MHANMEMEVKVFVHGEGRRRGEDVGVDVSGDIAVRVGEDGGGRGGMYVEEKMQIGVEVRV